MKKNFEIIIGYYTVYSNKNIGIINAIEVIAKAKEKCKYNTIFQYKKQKYIVIVNFQRHQVSKLGECWKSGDPPGLRVNWRPD